MRRTPAFLVIVSVVISSAALLSGCAANWKIGASCTTEKKCEIHGEISGTISSASNLVASAAGLDSNIDASQFKLDVSGSTVTYPLSGTVTISLIDSSNNSVQAAKLFNWYRTGTSVLLADPASVNSWSEANAGSADSVKYNITPFPSMYGPGDHTLSVASKYSGSTKASVAITVSGGCIPSGIYSPHPCKID